MYEEERSLWWMQNAIPLHNGAAAAEPEDEQQEEEEEELSCARCGLKWWECDTPLAYCKGCIHPYCGACAEEHSAYCYCPGCSRPHCLTHHAATRPPGGREIPWQRPSQH